MTASTRMNRTPLSEMLDCIDSARPFHITATYDSGVLTVSLPLGEAPDAPVKVPIARATTSLSGG